MDDQVPLGLGQRTLGSTTVTVDVQSYQLVFPNGRSEFLLQSPLSHDGPHGGKLLVRQERGARNNEVSFRDPQQLSRVESPPCSTYVHGIILKPPHEGNSRDGDAVWLSDEHWEPGSQIKQHEIRVVNLRTWERLTVSLEDVCWVPKYRKLDRGEGEEELLTVSGPPVRSTSNKLTYLLAIVQRLRGDNYTASTSDDGPRLEVKEIVEQEQFKYQNLNKLPDGTKRIKEHFERLLHDHASNQVPTTNPIRPRLREAISRTVSGLVTPPSEYIDCYDDEAEDSEFERDAEMLTRAGMANLTRAPNPVVPQTCNLPAHQCPTPPRTFFVTSDTRPSLAKPFPRHHHLLDHECPIGEAHEVHCIFAYPGPGQCVIPPTVRHTCCTPHVYALNERVSASPAVVASPGHGDVVMGLWSGTLGPREGIGEEEEYADLPVDVEMMRFDPRRDCDELGRRMFGVGQRDDVVDGEWIFAGLSVDGSAGDFRAADSADLDVLPVLGRKVMQEEPDAFGDRHLYGDDEDDLDDDEVMDGDDESGFGKDVDDE